MKKIKIDKNYLERKINYDYQKVSCDGKHFYWTSSSVYNNTVLIIDDNGNHVEINLNDITHWVINKNKIYQF